MILRPYQTESIDDLRAAFRQGHKRIVLGAPTGSGKSVMMLDMIRAAIEKRSRVMFICERRILVEQFSKHLDSIGIDHGVLMAKHWRFRPHALVQVASAQTLERMESWPAFDIVFIDELHACMRKSVVAMLKNRQDLRVVGATATPFHPAIAEHFTAITSVISMSALVENKSLVPFRVFVAKEIDVTGVPVVAGEWKKDELEARGRKIVGDIVTDYVRLSQEVFGGYRKTICFSCGVAHGADLVQRFGESGINAVQLTYKDAEEYKTEVLADFARPDTGIQMLVSADILTRGYDQTDVEHVILARPLKKSFSSHVQMVGRGARPHPGKEFCIASGQRVLTRRGLVAIEEVSLYDLLWDGQSFVAHKGVIYKGKKNVITYQGLTATSDHRVKTKEGWRSLGECSEKQIPIVQTGLGGSPIWESENIFSGCGVEGRSLEKEDVCALRVPNVLQKIPYFIQQFVTRNSWRLRQMQPAKNNHKQISSPENCCARAAMHKPKQPPVSRLWRAWNSIQVRERARWVLVGNGEFATTGGFGEIPTGSHRQREGLRAWEFEVGLKFREFVSHAKTNAKRALAFVQNRKPVNSLRRPDAETPFQFRPDGRTNHREIPQSIEQAQREVWDILDSGPRNCFTCEGLLVHNCVIQDNAGNWLRFAESWKDLYENGVQELSSDADKKSRKEPSTLEKEKARCPRCGSLWPSHSDTCSHCGHVRARRSEVIETAGEMHEIGGNAANRKHSMAYKTEFYAQLLGYAEARGYKPGYAFWAYKEKFGIQPGMAKPSPKTPQLEVINWLRSRQIARAKMAQKVAA